MFESLSRRLNGIQLGLKSKGLLKPRDVDNVLEEIQLALLEADVNLEVARNFTERVRDAAIGAEIQSALDPSQQVVKILNQELTSTLGGEAVELDLAQKSPTAILMVGLQGMGKTTSAVKLASWLVQKKRHPLLVGTDLKRPAAVEQLRILCEEAGIPMVSEGKTPKQVAANALKSAKQMGKDVVIYDTAGRLSIDRELLEELTQMSKIISPAYRFLVLDSMSGQDALGVSRDFSTAVDLNGIILTKLDGDARGGAALSVREVIGHPIYFAATGERLADFEVFHPDRLAGRILGMGDVLSLIEKAEQLYPEEQKQAAEESAQKLLSGQVGLDDFLEQMRMVQKLGMGELLGRLPNSSELGEVDVEEAEKKLIKTEAIICSMTPQERIRPEIIDSLRKRRIARGSGTTPNDVSALIREFLKMRKQLKKMKGLNKLKSRIGL